ncbi:MAG: pectate lyase [Bacteroides sp.]|nr:pectate lyase [Roseburia sp.]MCM1347078.1 pectate lyase [Bacteroides sp.]MCM1420539.1 pectate lyase [Bacteroides sp.]
MSGKFFLFLYWLGLSASAGAQEVDVSSMQWKNIVRMDNREWYASEEARTVADSVLKYQMPNGGWVKNQQWHIGADGKYLSECKRTCVGTTIDNGATWQEMIFLAKIHNAAPRKIYRQAFRRALDYILEAQYPNGGWRQFFPVRPTSDGSVHYSAHITFNDCAMTNVLRLLRRISDNEPPFSSLRLDKKVRRRVLEAYTKGIDCILRCQIQHEGQRTVWCQQHDEKTLLPAKARAYELPSYTAHGETVDILNLLMDIESPSDEIVDAVESAVKWLEEHAIHGYMVEKFTDAGGREDIRLVSSENAPALWARFYDLENAEPMFCDRDGIPRKHIEDIGYERRNGYSWLGSSPAQIIQRYSEWKRTLPPEP